MEIFEVLKKSLKCIVEEYSLDGEFIDVSTKVLSPYEAIGETIKKDYPLLTGKEHLMSCSFKGAIGQAFTSDPVNYSGPLTDVIDLDITTDRNRSIFISTLNAVYSYLNKITNCIHCKNNGPEICADKIFDVFKGSKRKIGIVGYQPSIIERLSNNHDLRILDLQPDNIGVEKYGVIIEDGSTMFNDVIEWCDTLLVTGSTICNGTLPMFLNLGKETYFFGTTIAASAYILGLERLCFADIVKNS